MPIAVNEDIAGRLDEVARILAEQGAIRFRVQAYHHAAAVLRGMARPVSEIYAEEGIVGLEKTPASVRVLPAPFATSSVTASSRCSTGCAVTTIPLRS